MNFKEKHLQIPSSSTRQMFSNIKDILPTRQELSIQKDKIKLGFSTSLQVKNAETILFKLTQNKKMSES